MILKTYIEKCDAPAEGERLGKVHKGEFECANTLRIDLNASWASVQSWREGVELQQDFMGYLDEDKLIAKIRQPTYWGIASYMTVQWEIEQ
jgi:hypothetical protein